MYRTTKRTQRTGSTYIIVLGTGLIVSVLGLAGLLVVRIQRTQVSDTHDLMAARLYARAGLDMALQRIATTSDWRQQLDSGAWEADQVLADGAYSFGAVDALDGNLTNSLSDPVTLTVTGKQGLAVHKLEARLVAQQDPLAALHYAAHAGQNCSVSNIGITVDLAPLSCNKRLNNGGTLTGSAVCETYAGSGLVTGTLSQWADGKPLPPRSVFDTYRAMATSLVYSGDMEQDILTPNVNSYTSGLNANGVYYIDCGGSTLRIKGSRIHGTLIVKGNVVLDDAASLRNYHLDYPALIVSGNLELKLKSGDKQLKEGNWSTNFNPSGAPYEGATDTDQLDSYPNEIQGLVHVQGNIDIRERSIIRGVILCDGSISCEKKAHLIHDPTLWYRPPVGYVAPIRMVIEPGSVRQVVP